MIQTRHNWNSQSIQTARAAALDIPPEHGGGREDKQTPATCSFSFVSFFIHGPEEDAWLK